jgi:hypothetical protein
MDSLISTNFIVDTFYCSIDTARAEIKKLPSHTLITGLDYAYLRDVVEILLPLFEDKVVNDPEYYVQMVRKIGKQISQRPTTFSRYEEDRYNTLEGRHYVIGNEIGSILITWKVLRDRNSNKEPQAVN